MWIPTKILSVFNVTTDAFNALREDLAAVRAERDSLKIQLSILQTNFDWIRIQINTLQFERTQLLEKAYNIRIPTPELTKDPSPFDKERDEFSFEDIGDDLARKLGLPTYDISDRP